MYGRYAVSIERVNEILCKVKKDPTFIWSPRGIMVDENGANKNAIRQVLGDYMAKRSWGCQWHYFRCTKHQSMKINEKIPELSICIGKRCGNQE